ncbi:uncharacterized protein LOC131160594 [Malania oleifera]|uniref:uncharacterized protein LOC131160594 n=1 Tax=Malania oleifera TaxID=397392 RepID=UPI0025ADF7E8|nr:uncharacterized protein LOC131160594 [Malania oleifera]
MDFHSLSRRELQALCKKNKIAANMTNVAMADALKALQIVEGLEDFTRPDSEKGLEVQEKMGFGSPEPPRTSTRRKPVKGDPESEQPMTRTRYKTSRGGREAGEEKEVPETPTASSTRRRGASTRRKAETSVKEENFVQRVHSTRRSTRLLEKMAGLSPKEKGKIDVIKITELSEEETDVKSVSVTDLKTSSEEGSERIDDSEIISNLKLSALAEIERDCKEEAQENEKGNYNGVNVLKEKVEDVIDDEAQYENKGAELHTKSEACNRPEECLVIPGVDSEKAVDGEAVQTSDEIGHSEVSATMPDTEDSDGFLISDNKKELDANQDIVTGDILSSSNLTAFIDQDQNPEILCQNMVSEGTDMNVPEGCYLEIDNAIEGNYNYNDAEADKKDFTASPYDDPSDDTEQVSCKEKPENGKDGILDVAGGENFKEEMNELVWEPITASNGNASDENPSEFQENYSDDAQITQKDSSFSPDTWEGLVSRLEQVDSGKEDGILDINDSENYEEDSYEPLIGLFTATEVFADGQLAVDNGSNSENSMNDESETQFAVDFSRQVIEFNNLMAPRHGEHPLPEVENGNSEEWTGVHFVAEEHAMTANECHPLSEELPNAQEQVSPNCQKLSEGELMGKTLFHDQSLSSNLCQVSEIGTENHPMLDTRNQTPSGVIMADTPFSTLASHLTLRKSVSKTPVSVQRSFHVLDDNKENIDNSGRKSSSKTPIRRMNDVLDVNKENIDNSGRKSSSKAPQKMIHVLDGNKMNNVLDVNKENIDNSGRKSSSKAPQKMIHVLDSKAPQKMIHVLDGNKENIGKSGRKNVELKKEKKKNIEDMAEDAMLKALNDTSLRQLRKMFKEKLQITVSHRTEDVNVNKAAKTRLALKALPENHLAREPEEKN